MKYKILIIIILLCFTSCKISRINNNKYKVYKIDKLNSYYIIYCEKGNDKYKIISKDTGEIYSKHQEIKIGYYYHFNLINYPIYNNDNPITGFTPLVNCFSFDDNTKICKEEGINGLYISTNIIGITIIR